MFGARATAVCVVVASEMANIDVRYATAGEAIVAHSVNIVSSMTVVSDTYDDTNTGENISSRTCIFDAKPATLSRGSTAGQVLIFNLIHARGRDGVKTPQKSTPKH